MALLLCNSLLYSQATNSSLVACTCNPNGFNPFEVTLNGATSTVRCGHQFSVKCGEPINMKGGYKCEGVCEVKFVAILKNAATGAIVQNYSSFNFPWAFTFATAGNYMLEITPICGKTKCTPCVFYFTVVCSPATSVCDCKEDGWQSFTSRIGNEDPVKVNCGFQFSFKKSVKFKLEGKYLCKGNCNTKYVAVLKNNVTGAIIQNYGSFTFPWSYAFVATGNYQLEITPICEGKKCQPCVFYFTVI